MRHKHYTILLVEDEVILRTSLARHIEQLDAGFVVACQASNGKLALDLLKTEAIDVVITDVRMPLVDGIELSKIVHEQYPHILTIILTGYAEFTYVRDALKQGVLDYLLKPVNEDDLEEALTRAYSKLCKYYKIDDQSIVGHSGDKIAEYTVLYLRNHYMEEIDFSTFADSMGFSRAYLTKIFNKHTGDTPIKYLTDIRINEAKHLLANTSLSIREVGEKVGYPDQFHFSKTFRKLTGMNPTTYRKQL